MAGDWIKMRCNLGSDPRVLRMADGLKLPELHVVGLLWRFWSWADQHTTCDAISVTESLIDRITCQGFASQLRAVGWLEVSGDAVVLTNFSEHNGQTAKQRSLTQRRMKRKRDADVTRGASPEKRREEKRRSNTIHMPQTGDGVTMEQVYDAYPRKVAKQDAMKAITAACRVKPLTHLLDRAKAFATAVESWKPEEQKFIPYPATWFRRGSYDDDPQTWQRDAIKREWTPPAGEY